MEYYKMNGETYEAYESLLKYFESTKELKGYRDGGNPTDKEDELLIAKEIYSYFGAHYFKCKYSIDQMKKSEKYNLILKDCSSINILDIGCSIGTATYACIDSILEERGNSKSKLININVVFIEKSTIRTKWLENVFENYKSNILAKYNFINMQYTILNNQFPLPLDVIEQALIKAPSIVLLSNFTNWNQESVLAKSVNELYDIGEEVFLLSIEGKKQFDKIKNISNQIKQFKIYDVNGPDLVNGLKYYNLKKSYYTNEKYNNRGYYQTNIEQQDIFKYMINDNNMLSSFNKAIYKLEDSPIVDELEVNYFLGNKIEILREVKGIIKQNYYSLYNDNDMKYKILKKDKTYRPIVIENGFNEIITISMLTSIGLCIDAQQDDTISFGNRLLNKDIWPYINKYYMYQYFFRYIINQKNIKEKKEYKYYLKLDLKSYYTTINHKKLQNSIDLFLSSNRWFNQGEWFKAVVGNYINRTNDPKIYNDIPQGSPLSGVLSNMYLKSFDEWFKCYFEEDIMFRYVDDIVIFSNKCVNNIKTECIKFLRNELGLEVNSEKCEEGKVKDLEFDELEELYNEISKATTDILSSIYNLPTEIYKLYKRNPGEIIYNIHRSLKSIGIYISQSWLSKKLRKKPNTFAGITIKWGKMYGKKPLVIDVWKKEFKYNNEKFIKILGETNIVIKKEFIATLKAIKRGEKDVLNLRKLKFLTNKLSLFTNEELVNVELFNYVKDKPWLLDLKKLKSYSGLCESVFQSINSDYGDYCNLTYIWLIGEYGKKESIYIEKILEVFLVTLRAKESKGRIANTLACTSLLKLKYKKLSINITEIEKELEKMILEKQVDYIYIRNCIFLINTFNSEWIITNEKILNEANLGIQLYELIKWVKSNLNKNITHFISPRYNGFGSYLPQEESTIEFDS